MANEQFSWSVPFDCHNQPVLAWLPQTNRHAQQIEPPATGNDERSKPCGDKTVLRIFSASQIADETIGYPA
jgi:hypothetical protein